MPRRAFCVCGVSACDLIVAQQAEQSGGPFDLVYASTGPILQFRLHNRRPCDGRRDRRRALAPSGRRRVLQCTPGRPARAAHADPHPGRTTRDRSAAGALPRRARATHPSGAGHDDVRDLLAGWTAPPACARLGRADRRSDRGGYPDPAFRPGRPRDPRPRGAGTPASSGSHPRGSRARGTPAPERHTTQTRMKARLREERWAASSAPHRCRATVTHSTPCCPTPATRS